MPAPVRLLSLEAGGERISAALFEAGACVAQAFEEARQRQTERLAPLVQGLLDGRAWAAASLDSIAAGRGPGSFTGLRSCLALGQGLALGGRAKLVGLNTLEAWAQASGRDKLAVALDGRRGQVYFGRYEKRDGAWQSLEAPALLDRELAWSRLGSLPLCCDLEAALLPPGVQTLPLPQAASLAVAVGQLALSGPPQAWEPLYLRRAEAEILWEKLHPKVG
jgi:tRNA threonylcarbamoyladenosine biosynthesis protein TsaB